MPDVYPLIAPLLTRLDAETAHGLALRFLNSGLYRMFYGAGTDDPVLTTTVWGRTFTNPVGNAAGFDKNAQAIPALFGLGFGFAEVGGVTLRPQPGNPRPRLFRLPEDRAVINRMGFNNAGADALAARLAAQKPNGVLGVNLGLNKDSTDAPGDFGALARRFAARVDFLTINVSSPNTPGLRALQNIGPLRDIVRSVRTACAEASSSPAVLLKIAPDLAMEDVTAIAALALAEKLDGMVISNTTLSRPAQLRSLRQSETGGLSGAPLFELSTQMLRHVYRETGGKLVLIGVGGIASGADAYAKIRAGASLIQLYSALVFDGPALIPRIKTELAELLHRDGFASVSAAVGADHPRTGT